MHHITSTWRCDLCGIETNSPQQPNNWLSIETHDRGWGSVDLNNGTFADLPQHFCHSCRITLLQLIEAKKLLFAVVKP